MAAVPEPTRGGEDVRRRGWFWHWNALVTQYAPLIGLKGVGLLNSYTVWTDRREESPHRGFAFPSQQSEADFYGEDRAELITINKILVALDLIEIRKEMVVRADPQGRRWKVPHNFYRVKDHGDDFSLSTDDVLRVAELAARDRAVYRYVRRVFSPRFAPIDGANVWTRILPEVRQTPLWQGLATKAAAEEDRASARTRAGHAARKGAVTANTDSETHASPPFFVSMGGDDPATGEEDNDSMGVNTIQAGQTSVANANTGSTVDVDQTNNGSRRSRPTTVGPINTARTTSVAPANTTYDQIPTTTREMVSDDDPGQAEAFTSRTPPHRGTERRQPAGPAAAPPTDAASEEAALRAFESANDRSATPAERKLLRDLAVRFDPVATLAAADRDGLPASGWGWLEAAVWEAVEAGSAFVAPRRLREILLRWERDGFPAPQEKLPAAQHPTPVPPRPTRGDANLPAPRELPAQFTVEEVGLSNRQVWAMILAEAARQGEIGAGDFETWLRPAHLIGRDGDFLVVGTPTAVGRDRLATRLLGPLHAAVAAAIGVPLAVEIVVEGEWLAEQPAS